MSGGLGRLEVIGAALLLSGLLLSARAAWRLFQAIRARSTYGAPYRRGTIADRLLGLALLVPGVIAGAGLLALAAAQDGFQPSEGRIRAGQIEARRSGWGRVSVRFVPDPQYPARGVLEGEIAGARWALGGDFITWDEGVRWLGLRDGHRVRYLLGTRDTTGLSRTGPEDAQVLDPLPPAAARLLAWKRFLPFLTVRTGTTPWFPPAERQVMVLYAAGPGYLADSAVQVDRSGEAR